MMREKVVLLIAISAVIGGMVSIFLFENSFQIFVTISVFCFLLFLFNYVYSLFIWIDPTTLFIINYITFIGIGVLFASAYNIFLPSVVLLSLVIGLVSFLIGALSFDIVSYPLGRVRVIYPQIILSSYSSLEKNWAWLFLLLGALIISYYYYLVGGIPLLATDAENIRVTLKAGRGYLPIFAYAFFAISTMKIMAIAALKNKRNVFFALLITVFASILMMGVGFRAPALKLFLNIFIIFTYIRFRRIPVGWLIFVGSLILLSVGILGYFRLQSGFTSNIALIFRIGAWRIFVNNLSVLNLIFKSFPSSEPYMLGRSYLIDATTLLPGAQPHFGFWLKDRFGLTFEGGGVTQTIVGELYLNWSWIGIVLGMFIVGIMFRLLYHSLVKKHLITTSRLVLLTLLSTSLMAMISSGILLVLLFDTMPLVIIFVFYQLCVNISRSMLKMTRFSAQYTTIL